MHKDITIYDLARELSLSAATISRALKDHPAINKNTKKRIVEKAEEMGYRSNILPATCANKKATLLV
ncbi:MAG: LacI family DNA-binding transcriptional regulator [Ferruginibacter sp.]